MTDSDALLVVGASGLVGTELACQARNAGRSVVGAARSRAGEADTVLDLVDAEQVGEVVDRVRPAIAAVCSAWPHVDGCEADPARSHRENVETVQHLVDALDPSVLVVFYSSDHVFPGREEPYVENDAVAPANVYARHKREVEELLLARGNALVLRTAWVFGEELRRKNFVYRVIDVARAGGTLRVPEGQAGCPTWAGWLVSTTLALIDRGLTGVVHASGSQALTKAQWARVVASELDLPDLAVQEVTEAEAGQIAPRPHHVALASERHELVQPDVHYLLRTLRPQLLESA